MAESKRSVFYQERYDQPWALTFMLLERFAVLQEAVPEADLSDSRVPYMNLEQALMELRAPGAPDPENREIGYLLQRLSDLAAEVQEKEDQDSGDQLGFGTSFLKYLEKLDAGGNCLYLANGDYAKAGQYYREVDVRTIARLVGHAVGTEWERHRVTMEAALYGFGGSYEGSDWGDSGPDADRVYDMTEGGDKASLMSLSNVLKRH